MIAYVFWHWPDAGTDLAAYEAAQRAFHAALNQNGSEGFQRSLSYRVAGAPWIPGGTGYEDWYLLDGSHALDPLNDLAVSPALRGAHDSAAHAATGAGGLYRLMRGVPRLASGPVAWMSKPNAIAYPDFYARFGSDAVLWRRQMVLGPAPEFLAETAAPEGLEATITQRELFAP